MMKTKLLTLATGFVFSAGLALAVQPQEADAASYSSTVDYIKDGDTLMLQQPVNGTREVRFLGVDAPETFVINGKDPGNQIDPHGNAAKQYVQDLLPKGTEITLITDKEELDGQGRLLAYIYKNGTDVNKGMLEKGLVVPYVIWPNTHETTRYETYRTAMLYAQENGFGVWNPSNPLQELPFEYRDRMFNDTQDKFVGDFYTKQYVDPADYKNIAIENRVFFFTEPDAIEAGYTQNSSTGGDTGSQTPISAEGLFVNEILADPYIAYSNEFVELYNGSNADIDISGYKIDDIANGGQAPYTIPNGTIIKAGGFYVFETNYFFNNSGDDVRLIAPDGSVVDSFTYSSSQNDYSWARSIDGGNWSQTMDSSPTKGASNN